MPDLSKANAVRLDAALDRQYRFASGTSSFRHLIETGTFSASEAADVSKITYDRSKFNRMDHKQQAEYNRRLSETKTEYRLIYSDDADRFVVVPKIIFDWFNARH